jgi:tRNA pseudouridine55 synthase
MPSGLDGVVVIDKEPGWTSHDVVAKLRSILHERRIGHAGTLDPDATGVLVLAVGRSTRLLRFLSATKKHYHAEVTFGVATDTLDAGGKELERVDMSHLCLEEVAAAAATFLGTITQIPPMVSAIKIDGKRLHELARQGIEVERVPRPVTIFEIAVHKGRAQNIYNLDVVCSAGTYIRVLAADLGKRLGGVAHMSALRRSQVGAFSLDDAIRLGEVTEASLWSPARALSHLESVTVDEKGAKEISHGRPLNGQELGVVGPGPFALVNETGTLLAVYEKGVRTLVAAVVMRPQ